jgi:phosphinothricin acetyltransferase
MKTRLVKESDLKEIVEIYNQAIEDGDSTADLTPFTVEEKISWLNKHDGNPYSIFVAVDNGIAGYCSLSAYRPGREALTSAAEVSFFVRRNRRRQGVGRMLLRAALEQASYLGFETIFAILLDVNTVSKKLLLSEGFSEWGYLPDIAKFPKHSYGQYILGKKVERQKNDV